MTYSDREIQRLIKANMETESRMIYRDADPIYGDDTGRRTAALLARMEAKHRERRRDMDRIACRAVTGLSPAAFVAKHRDGIRAGYTPSVSAVEHGSTTAAIFSQFFEGIAGRPAVLY